MKEMVSNQNLVQLLTSKNGYLNPALKRIADYVLSHLEICKTITIKDLAAACDVAESTITRFVKEIGFQSYQDFKIAIAESLIHHDSATTVEESVYENIKKEDSIDEIIQKVFFLSMQKLNETKALINTEELGKAVEAIKKASTLIFISIGSSSVAATEAIMRFTRAGKRCLFWNDSSMQTMVSATTGPDDLIIGISDSGKTKQIVDAVKRSNANGTPSIVITSNPQSPLAAISHIVLFTPQSMEANKIKNYWESMTSKNAQLMIMDILYVGFAIDQYEITVQNLNKTTSSLKYTRE